MRVLIAWSRRGGASRASLDNFVIEPVTALTALDLTLERSATEVSNLRFTNEVIDNPVKVTCALNVATQSKHSRSPRNAFDSPHKFLLFGSESLAVFADGHVSALWAEIAAVHQARTGRHGDGCDDPEFGGGQEIIHGRPPVQECRRG